MFFLTVSCVWVFQQKNNQQVLEMVFVCLPMVMVMIILQFLGVIFPPCPVYHIIITLIYKCHSWRGIRKTTNKQKTRQFPSLFCSFFLITTSCWNELWPPSVSMSFCVLPSKRLAVCTSRHNLHRRRGSSCCCSASRSERSLGWSPTTRVPSCRASRTCWLSTNWRLGTGAVLVQCFGKV